MLSQERRATAIGAFILLVYTIIGGLAYQGACASRSVQLRHIASGLDAARVELAETDRALQTAIVRRASTRAEAESLLAIHRTRRDYVVGVLVSAYAALGAAATHDDAESMRELGRLAGEVAASVVELAAGRPVEKGGP